MQFLKCNDAFQNIFVDIMHVFNSKGKWFSYIKGRLSNALISIYLTWVILFKPGFNFK